MKKAVTTKTEIRVNLKKVSLLTGMLLGASVLVGFFLTMIFIK